MKVYWTKKLLKKLVDIEESIETFHDIGDYDDYTLNETYENNWSEHHKYRDHLPDEEYDNFCDCKAVKGKLVLREMDIIKALENYIELSKDINEHRDSNRKYFTDIECRYQELETVIEDLEEIINKKI